MKNIFSLDGAALRKALGWSLVVAAAATVVASLAIKAAAQTAPALAATATSAVTGPSAHLNSVPASTMAHSCAACHGTHGQLGDEFFMPLAGMPVAQFVRTMTDFREGKRPATLMGHVARGFTDADIQAMGEFFTAQPPLAGTLAATQGVQ